MSAGRLRFSVVQDVAAGNLRVAVVDADLRLFAPVFRGSASLIQLVAAAQNEANAELARAQRIADALNANADLVSTYTWRGQWAPVGDERLRCSVCGQLQTWDQVGQVAHVDRVGGCCAGALQDQLQLLGGARG